MSSGNFVRSKYESNSGNIYSCSVQPETLLLELDGTANDEPAGSVDTEPSAYMSSSTRRLGVNARTVRLAWTGSPPTGYDAAGVISVPIMTPALFNSISRGTTGTYLTAGVEVVGKTNEKIN